MKRMMRLSLMTAFGMALASPSLGADICYQLFDPTAREAQELFGFEVDTSKINPAGSSGRGRVSPRLSEFARGLQEVPDAQVLIQGLKDGNIAISIVGVASDAAARIRAQFEANTELTAQIKAAIVAEPKTAWHLTFSSGRLQVRTLVRRATPEVLKVESARVAHFTGKHSYLPFLNYIKSSRMNLDHEFPPGSWGAVGSETPFGTKLANTASLVGHEIAGVSIRMNNEGVSTIERPLDGVTVETFSGTVLSQKEVDIGGADPMVQGQIRFVDGSVRTISLTDVVGLRLRGRTPPELNAATAEAAADNRRKASFEAFRRVHAEPMNPRFAESFRDHVIARLESVPPEMRSQVKAWRRQILEGIRTNPLMRREAYDRARRPMKKIKNEDVRPIVEETHRLLFDTESIYGFNAWLMDLATLVVIDAHETGTLRWGSRDIRLRDVHFNFPFGEGKNGIPMRDFRIDNVPLLSARDLLRTLDKLAIHYTFDRNISRVSGLKLQEGARAIGTLEGFSLEESTPAFLNYSRNHILFLDTYFKGKPHGQYAHIFQWLYLAERFSQSSQNAFGAPMSAAFFQHVQSYFMDDFVAGVTVTDFVGQRAPQNPDHVNNLLQWFFPVD
jgi:hypothetical protein